ncbi:LruC domain-containing protein [Algoriphagus namhaensis]|uniref:LruC domain-containing protein n=1 Tax=Algoriphagus namhaensis TaxID=915353 RepID=A0ABV8AT32_9BACT
MKNIYLILLAFGLFSCVQEPDFVKETKDAEQQLSTNEYGNFDFSLTNSVNFIANIADEKGLPFSGVKIKLTDPESASELFVGFTDAKGLLQQEISLPSAVNSVFLEANYIGITEKVLLPVDNDRITFDYLGSVNENQVLPYEETFDDPDSRVYARVNNSFKLVYAASYNSSGLPSNLEPQREYISSTLLEYINASLPESKPVPTFHPTYLAEGKKTTLDILETADVWFTFVHEGAGWRNSIGFYTYPTQSPPQTIADIEEITILFPNLSKKGSGGSLESGHKVRLGRFEPGVSIGIVLLANGWTGSEVAGYPYALFADKRLNPESDPNLKQHNVLLWDEENKQFLLGFEDVRRDSNSCDQDFNDAILFISSNPVKAISTVNVSPIDRPGTLDRDNDGINDTLDEYPDDPNRAYNSYYPSASTFGSLAFEDNWPNMGDYDFNDLVVDYRFQFVMNSSNRVAELDAKFKFRAAGAGYRNGFGFATNLPSSAVLSATGSNLGPNLIKLNPNGTEAGQSKAVFIVADNVHQLFGVSSFINTEIGQPALPDREVNLEIVLSSPVTLSEIGTAPYNPFLIVSQDRGREVHLPGYKPTDLAHTELFGTANDGTNPAQGKYYVSKTSLPWAIHLPESFDYPVENVDVRGAHLLFDTWAKSSGYSYMDWYRNHDGYRNKNKVFKK